MAEKKTTSGTKKASDSGKTKSKTASKSATGKPKSAPASASKTRAKEPTKEMTEQMLRIKRQRIAIILFAAAALLFFVAAIRGENIWFNLHHGLFGLFGICAWALPILLFVLAVFLTKDKAIGGLKFELIFAALLVLLLSGIIHVGINETEYLKGIGIGQQILDVWATESYVRSGGVLGVLVGSTFAKLFGKAPAMITMILALLVSLMFFSGTTLQSIFHLFSRRVKSVGDMADERIEKGMERRRAQEEKREERRARREEERAARAQAEAEKEQTPETQPETTPAAPTARPFNPDISVGPDAAEALDYDGRENFLPDFIYSDNDHSQPASRMHPPVLPDIPPVDPSATGLPADADLPLVTDPRPARAPRKKKPAQPQPETPEAQTESGFEVPAPEGEPQQAPAYRKPPLTLLREPVVNSEYGSSQAEIEHNSALLIKTLESFNVHATISGVFRGPSVTRYELVPAEGVKISKITALADDIALRLAASGVRIEAPIPNKAAIGIEVPNRAKASVTLREIIDTDVYSRGTSKSILNVAVGKDIAGNVICADLSKMPHLLIAGTTGSGKSVCVNSMIMSILFNADPNEVKLLMIDPKQVEFTVYGGIPHLLVPVVSDPRKASGALGWAVTEMLGRYKKFSERNVRDISGYNRLADEDPSMERMSRIVIFIDELSDLMMVAQSEVEDAICRLAQMARAAGMHLVIATQRPSVDVITGLIKANIPSRIALSVSSQVDSRTIIDTAGAEKLLGYGDMLFSPVGMAKPLRVQGCFVSEREVEDVVNFIKHQKESTYDETVMDEIERQAVSKKKGADLPTEEDPESAEDPKLMKAIEIVVEAGMASTTMLQRKLSLGYGRAARIIDQLEQRKIVGPFEGSKPRKVLITRQQWMEMCAMSSGVPPIADADDGAFDDDEPPFDMDEYEDVEADFE